MAALSIEERLSQVETDIDRIATQLEQMPFPDDITNAINVSDSFYQDVFNRIERLQKRLITMQAKTEILVREREDG